MHKTLRLVVVLLPFMISCGKGDDLRGKRLPNGMTTVEYDRLLKLNGMLEDNIDARKSAFETDIAPMISEKAKALGKLIQKSCSNTGRIPDNELSGGTHTHKISGNDCPVYWYRERGFQDQLVHVIDNLEIKNQDYEKLVEMSARRMSGDYSLVRTGTQKKISGTINIHEFNTKDYGSIQGSITTDQVYEGEDGVGYVQLYLQSTKGWKHTGKLSWEIRSGNRKPVVFRVDGVKIKEDEFQELFSSFELIKIMDNSLKMK